MFPIRDDNPRILTPYATYGIALLNVATWIFVQGMGMEPAVPSINSSCMRLANFLQPGCFGRLHVGRFKSRRRLYSGVEV